MIAATQVLAAPAIAGVLLASTPTMSIGMLFLAYMTAETWLGPGAAIVQVSDVLSEIYRANPQLHSSWVPRLKERRFQHGLSISA